MNVVEHWNKYDEVGIGIGAYTDTEKLFLLAKDKNILEVGCGRGLMLSKITSATKRSGIDPSSVAVDFASLQNPDIEYQVAFAEKLPFEDNSFDLVYSLEVIEHVKNYQSMVDEIYRVLKPGGQVFIQTPNYPIKRLYDFIFWVIGRRESLADDYTHVTKLSSFKLKKILENNFLVIDVYSRNILLDSRLTFLKNNFFRKKLGLLIGQKTIIIGTKK